MKKTRSTRTIDRADQAFHKAAMSPVGRAANIRAEGPDHGNTDLRDAEFAKHREAARGARNILLGGIAAGAVWNGVDNVSDAVNEAIRLNGPGEITGQLFEDLGRGAAIGVSMAGLAITSALMGTERTGEVPVWSYRDQASQKAVNWLRTKRDNTLLRANRRNIRRQAKKEAKAERQLEQHEQGSPKAIAATEHERRQHIARKEQSLREMRFSRQREDQRLQNRLNHLDSTTKTIKALNQRTIAKHENKADRISDRAERARINRNRAAQRNNMLQRRLAEHTQEQADPTQAQSADITTATHSVYTQPLPFDLDPLDTSSDTQPIIYLPTPPDLADLDFDFVPDSSATATTPDDSRVGVSPDLSPNPSTIDTDNTQADTHTTLKDPETKAEVEKMLLNEHWTEAIGLIASYDALQSDTDKQARFEELFADKPAETKSLIEALQLYAKTSPEAVGIILDQVDKLQHYAHSFLQGLGYSGDRFTESDSWTYQALAEHLVGMYRNVERMGENVAVYVEREPHLFELDDFKLDYYASLQVAKDVERYVRSRGGDYLPLGIMDRALASEDTKPEYILAIIKSIGRRTEGSRGALTEDGLHDLAVELSKVSTL